MFGQFLGVYPVCNAMPLNTPRLKYYFLIYRSEEYGIPQCFGHYDMDYPALLAASKLESDQVASRDYRNIYEKLTVTVAAYRQRLVEYNLERDMTSSFGTNDSFSPLHSEAREYLQLLWSILKRELDLSYHVLKHLFEIDDVEWQQDMVNRKTGPRSIKIELTFPRGLKWGQLVPATPDTLPRLRHMGPMSQNLTFQFESFPLAAT